MPSASARDAAARAARALVVPASAAIRVSDHPSTLADCVLPGWLVNLDLSLTRGCSHHISWQTVKENIREWLPSAAAR